MVGGCGYVGSHPRGPWGVQRPWARSVLLRDQGADWTRRPVIAANAQPSLAFYAWDETADAYLPFALNVLTIREDLVSDVTAFIVRTTDAPEPEAYERFPEQPFDPRTLAGTFKRFGLPDYIR